MRDRLIRCVCLLVCLAGVCADAISASDVLKALDNPTGVEVVGFTYCKPKVSDGDIVYDDDTGEIKWATKPELKSSSEYWTVQSKTEYHTQPQSGGSCLRSKIGMADWGRCAIILKVLGPGTFMVRGKTATGFDDCLNIYVDGDCQSSLSGYNTDYEPGTDDWEDMEVTVPRGLAEGGRYEGTYYHEIIIEFEKDGWSIDDDGPYKPVRSDYDDKADYEADYADYKAELAYYEDCVWIDAGFVPVAYDEQLLPSEYATCWAPEAISLTIDTGEDTEFVDKMTVVVYTNAYDFGYTVRYTLDGTVPTGNSSELKEQDTLTLQQTCTVTAKVFTTKGGYSPEIMARQTFTKVLAAPVITLDKEASDDAHFVYAVTSSDAAATLYYSINNSAEQTYSKPVAMTAAGTFSVVARLADGTASPAAVVSVSQAQVPVVTAQYKGSVYSSGTLIEAGYTATVSATVSEGTLMMRQNDGSWKEYTAAVKCKNTSLFQFKTMCDGKLTSSVVDFSVRIAEQEFAFDGYLGPMLTLGWNCVSFPLELTRNSQQELLSTVPVFTMTASGSFQSVTVLERGRGYFVYVTDYQMYDAINKIWLWGAADGALPPLSTGWNLCGTREDVDPADIVIWAYENGQLVPTETMLEGHGYWIKAKP